MKLFGKKRCLEKYKQYQIYLRPAMYNKNIAGRNLIYLENKVGYTSLTKRIRKQIDKDAELMKVGRIDGAHWHFFTSKITGKGGASKQLLDYLSEKGINYTIH